MAKPTRHSKNTLPASVVLNSSIRTKPPKFSNPDDLESRIKEYFKWCEPHYEFVQEPFFVGTTMIPKYRPKVRFTKEEPLSMSGLAEFLDCSRTTLWKIFHNGSLPEEEMPKWMRDIGKENRERIVNSIKKALARIEHYWECKLAQPGAAAGTIFALINNFKNWQDVKVHMSLEEAELREEVEMLRAQVAARFYAVRDGKSSGSVVFKDRNFCF